MPVENGRSLRHYRITAKLGAGGMGDVYCAKDTRLGREVAIKVVPEELSTDPERLTRFEREAKVLASLNHPHIAQIYGLEEDRDRRFLVLELVEGETLAERIGRGPLPIKETLPIAHQITEALEAAHERGIIHRDLKPANIMLTPDGEAKVLDFGIAKPVRTATEDQTSTRTLTRPPTRAGVLMGTPTYMSPEQVRGQGVDKRSDIWAFGVVLWEMLTGARLFDGDTDSDILRAVMQVRPSWQDLPPGTPGAVTRLLRRCLERDPRERLHDIADARLEIEEAIAHPEPTSVEEVAQPGQGFREKLRAAWPALAAAFGLGIVLAGLVAWQLVDTSDDTPGTSFRFTSSLPSGVTLRAYEYPTLALSPDGHGLVFVGEKGGTSQLYRRDLEQYEAVPIPGTKGGYHPFFSPDGR
jgi:serine/threonine protein kinase